MKLGDEHASSMESNIFSTVVRMTSVRGRGNKQEVYADLNRVSLNSHPSVAWPTERI